MKDSVEEELNDSYKALRNITSQGIASCATQADVIRLSVRHEVAQARYETALSKFRSVVLAEEGKPEGI